jgi:hypothetical protein
MLTDGSGGQEALALGLSQISVGTSSSCQA